MTPPFPSVPDPLPPELFDAIAGLPAAEQDALAHVWRVAGAVAAPPPSAERRAATWSVLQREMTAPRRADRAPVRRTRSSRLLPTMAACAALLVAGVLSWPLFAPPAPEAALHWQAAGEVLPVHLPDGTLVRLEPGASLHAAGNAARERAYTLSGTATFEVARDEARPFHVRTERLGIAVLGTTFRVASEPGGRARVVVHEGHVAVEARDQRVEARRGEQVIAPEAGEPLVVRPLPESAEAVFAYRNASLPTVLREIELLFCVQITYPAELAGARITITRHGPLDARELLQSACAPLGLRFRRTAGGFEVYRPA